MNEGLADPGGGGGNGVMMSKNGGSSRAATKSVQLSVHGGAGFNSSMG
jgi:hypothetical protein